MGQYRIPKAKGMRVREAAPEYQALPPHEAMPVPPIYHVTVTDRGRLVLPAELRDRLHIADGDRVALTLEDDGRVTLQTHDVAIRRMRGMFKHVAPHGQLASDGLIADRRHEARREDRKVREWLARHRKTKRR